MDPFVVPKTPNILVLDGHQSVRQELEAVFRKMGWNWAYVAGVQPAASRLAHEQFDVVIADLLTDHSENIGLLNLLRKRNPQQPVIFIKQHDSVESDATEREDLVFYLEPGNNGECLEDTVNRLIATAVDPSGTAAPGAPWAVSMTECLTSREVAEYGYPFRILDTLHARQRISLHTKLKITVALQEALTNSVDHGNLELESSLKESFDPEGKDLYTERRIERLENSAYGERVVTIYTECDDDRLMVRITDQGNGFQCAQEANSSSPRSSGALKPHGRGLVIMHQAMDSVEYSLGGRQITLVKQLNNGSGE